MSPSTSKSNVLPFVHPAIADFLSEFERSKTIDNFLALMTVVVQTPNSENAAFEVWQRARDSIALEGAWPKVCEWLSRLNLIRGEADHDALESAPQVIPTSSEVAGIARAIIETANAEHEYRQSKMQASGYPYDMFQGAWPFEEQLKKYPSIERAAQLINRFVRHMFSGKQRAEPENIVVRIPVPPLIHFLVTDVLDAVFEYEFDKVPESGKNKQLDGVLVKLMVPSILLYLGGTFSLTEPNLYPPGFTISRLAVVLEIFPDAFRSAVIAYITNDLMEHESDNSVEAFQHLLDPILNSPKTSVLEFGPILWALKASNVTTQVGATKVESILKRFLNRLSHERKKCNGVSSLAWEQADDVCQEIGGLAYWHDWNHLLQVDLAILMAPSTYTAQTNPNLFNNEGLPPEEYCDLGEGGISRCEWYLRVCRAAKNEGYFELSNACLAFFLFSQPQLCNGRLFCDWKDLSDLLVASASMPGANAVRDAAGIAIEIIRSHQLGEALDALNLEGWKADTAASVDVEQLMQGLANHRNADSSLQTALGSKNWLKLSIEAKHALLSAEKSWMAVSADIGQGNVDFGVIAVGYIKAIELELTKRCQFLLSSPGYDLYCREKFGRSPNAHLTLGTVIGVLRDYARLPTSLQRQIDDTGMRLQNDGGLLKRLWGMTNTRNSGAHSIEVDDEKLIQLRTDLFKNGVLKRFVESLDDS